MEEAYEGMADQTFAWYEEMRSGVANRDNAGIRYTYEFFFFFPGITPNGK